MLGFIFWYLLVTLVGWITFPIAYRLLDRLSDKGFALARPLGLLLWGYIFWLLTSLQILQNNSGGVILAMVFLISLSVACSWGEAFQDMISWIKNHRQTVIITEILFFLAFLGWTIVRAANPEIIGTEKPMELAFINSILRSPTFPPNDPWLSGYAISYYYFGYVLVAMITRLTGVDGAIAFNLAISLWFALTAVAAYGLLFTLLVNTFTKEKSHEESSPKSLHAWAFLGSYFILLLSNIEGFLEMLHARGIFWEQTPDGKWQSGFWSWLGILEINKPPSPPFSWIPERVGGFWWWRASRVLQDFDIIGNSREIIDEFPAFSFLLADLHPHVLAMPFVILAVGLCLNFYYKVAAFGFFRDNIFVWGSRVLGGENLPLRESRLFEIISKVDFWMAAIVLGGLAFLNTWDFPMYVGLFCGAYFLAMYQKEGWTGRKIGEFVELGLALGIAGFILYIPFYTGFSSQAGGILPSLEFFTNGVQLWVMFATLLLPIFTWLFWSWKTRRFLFAGKQGAKISLLLVGGLWLFSYLLGGLIIVLAEWGSSYSNEVSNGVFARLAASFANWGGSFFGLHGGSDPSGLLVESFIKRLGSPVGWLSLAILIFLVIAGMAEGGVILDKKGKHQQNIPVTISAERFVLLMMLLGACLVVAPEYIYLRDQFGWRMNTIFKFYFQAWILWGISAAYASVVLWKMLKGVWSWVYRTAWLILILMGSAYPFFGILEKTNNFNPAMWSLDGSKHIELFNSKEEIEAIQWLKLSPAGVLSEAVGGSYSEFARISTYTGLPTVLGWPGHESQWRGGASEMGTRETDLQKLYITSKWEDALVIIKRYNIRYIYIGNLERSRYRVNETKFQNHLTPVFREGNVVIYEFYEHSSEDRTKL